MKRITALGGWVFCALALLGLSGCVSWSYQPLAIPEDLRDVHHASEDDVAVAVSILSDSEAEQHFGVDLGSEDIQAIWLHVDNSSDSTLWFLRAALDMDFYPAGEVAMVMKSTVPRSQFGAFTQRLRNESMRLQLPPHSRTEGFVFAPKALGGRYVDIRLVQDVFEAEQRAANSHRAVDIDDFEFRFGFALPLPDGLFDYERLDPEHTYANRALPDLDSNQLHDALLALPCCSLNADADEHGDPLNIAIIGESSDVLNSLARVGWSFTHRITLKSVSRLVGAALSGDSYPVAPVSPLYLFDRKQDFALQRARAGIAQRNHMRLWLAPFTYQQQQVWIGQISRDVGIKVTSQSGTGTTHIIDPEVDQAREYLLQSLLGGGFVRAFGFVSGSKAASKTDPAYNLVGDPYFSDGKRLVVLLSSDPVPYRNVRSLLWERSAAPVAEGQSVEARDNPQSLQ